MSAINISKTAVYMKHFLLSLFPLFLLGQLHAQPSSCFSMYVSTEAATPGETVCLEVKAEGIANLLGFQYTLRWDPAALRFSHLDNFNLPGLNDSAFGTQPAAVDNGWLPVSWFDATLSGVDVSAGQVIYSVCFEVLGAPAGLHAVYFGGQPTPIEFVTADTELIRTYALANGGAYSGSGAAPAVTAACALPPDCRNGGSVDISVTGGQPLYTFDWQREGITVSTAEDLSSATGGQYSLQATDAQGLVASAIFSLQENTIEYFYSYECADSAGNYTATLSCTVAAGGASPYTFSWNTGQVETSQQASTISGVPGVGQYSVTITDANGCVQAADTFELDCAQASQFLTAYSYECRFFGNDSTVADVSLVVWSGGTPPYTFEWSNGEVDVDSLFSVNEGLSNGAYTVTITDANGLAHQPAPAVVDCAPAPPEFTVGTAYECTYFPAEDSVSIDITAVVWDGPEPPYTFSWSNGEVETDILQSTTTVSAPGTYSVTITDTAGNTHVEVANVLGCGPATGRLAIEEEQAPRGDVVCVGVSAAQMQGLDFMLMAISWNPNALELDSVQPGLIASGFGLSEAANGLFQLNWSSDGVPLDIPNAAPLFHLCFRVLAPAGQSTPVFFTFAQAPEAYDSNGQPIGLIWQDGAVLALPDDPADAVQLVVESTAVEPGSSVCLDITTANFTDILGVQFTVRWDTASLQFDSLLVGALPGLGPATNFNLNYTGNGYLPFAFIELSPNPISLTDGESLFTLCFTTSSSPGSSTVSLSSAPTFIEVSGPNGILPVTVTNGTVVTLYPEVWPGDTDTDETVNHYDLLNIGLAYDATGPPRPNASTGWVQQAAADWQQATPLSLVDYKHIDTDGNGLIDAADTLAIVQNWGLDAEGRPAPGQEAARQINTVLYVRPDTVTLGESAVFDVILGDESAPAEGIYGLAFTIVYDTAAVEPGSAFMTFEDSWLGQAPLSLLALSRGRYDDGRIDLALTRIDGQDVSGQGPIAQLHITIQDVIFLRSSEYEMILDIENARLINSREEWAAVVAQPTVIPVGEVLSDAPAAEGDAALKVFPAPAHNWLFIHSPEHSVKRVEVMSMDGCILLVRQNATEIPVAGLPAGPYVLRVWTEAGVSMRKIVVR